MKGTSINSTVRIDREASACDNLAQQGHFNRFEVEQPDQLTLLGFGNVLELFAR